MVLLPLPVLIEDVPPVHPPLKQNKKKLPEQPLQVHHQESNGNRRFGSGG